MILDSFRLDNKTALVTGASRGLGAAIAAGLAEAGARIICHGNSRTAEQTANHIVSRGGMADVVQGDLSQHGSASEVFAQSLQRFGAIDILVNNAGAIRRAPAVDYSFADWSYILQVNLTSAFELSQMTGRHIMERCATGKILNIASVLSFQGGITVPAYAAAKGGIAQLTKALANEWGSKGVNVNAIAPGYMETDNTEALRQDPVRSQRILERIPAGRWGTPVDVVGAAVFLCSDASSYVNGHILVIDGGWLGR